MLKNKQYKDYILFDKNWESLLDDVREANASQINKVRPFNYFDTMAAASKPLFAKNNGGTVGGITIPAFSYQQLDDLFDSLFSEKWLSKLGATSYEYNETVGIYIPRTGLIKSPLDVVPQYLFDKWNHLWQDMMTREWDPLDNVSRFEYTEYGKIFGGAHETIAVDSERTNTTTVTGTETTVKTGSDTSTLSGSDTSTASGSDASHVTGTDSTAKTGTDTSTASSTGTNTYGKTSTDTIAAFNSESWSNDTENSEGGSDDSSSNSNTGITYNTTDTVTHNTTDTMTYGKTDTMSYGKTDTMSYNTSDALTHNTTNTETLAGGELHRVHGNVGVTRTDELLAHTIDYRTVYRFYKIVMQDLADILFLKCY